MDDKSYFRIPKKWVRTGFIVAATALIVAPLAAVASDRFNDVPNTNTFHDDIAWLANAGITQGCNPPENTEFCPDEAVTRGQMAAFMRRFAEYLGAEDGGSVLKPRAVYDFTQDAPDGEELTLTKEITAPEPGIILLTGTVDTAGGLDELFACELRFEFERIPGSLTTARVDESGGNHEEDCTTTGAITVDKGRHNVSFEVLGVAASNRLSSASMWALWVPTDGRGDTPSP